MGMGDADGSDHAAVESMRRSPDPTPIDGAIVIGERDQTPMLYIGEKVGAARGSSNGERMRVDIAVDPLEGTNLCCSGGAGAITMLAAAEAGGLLHAPDWHGVRAVMGSGGAAGSERQCPERVHAG
jgi:fructose-1,6-bisphosphatase/sedoheptulose 1,7-bisphosphatase-like protein